MNGYDIQYNTKRFGRVEHRSPWGRVCYGYHCQWCLKNRVHSKIKKYLWHMDEWEEHPSSNYKPRISTYKFAGFPHKKKKFKMSGLE